MLDYLSSNNIIKLKWPRDAFGLNDNVGGSSKRKNSMNQNLEIGIDSSSDE